ncbi:MAG: UDP-N-acetylglucosamine 1-carboxyvinyltransferase [Calditrichaeota bacterium]|nr:MAG: UDP-N-acetylglucosamine 1-carboxyvinyltransferase [Calditrichota bacterium]
MDKFVVEGGYPLEGEVEVSGSKNAALPIMAATLLAPGKYRIFNVPRLRDVRTMAHLLRIIGAKVDIADHTLEIDTTLADFPEAPYELVRTMRASIYVLGPLLARFGRARVSLPGGCAWGPRPVDLHIKGMQKLGAEIDLDYGYINARSKQLTGAHIALDVASVGATGNIMMAATLAEGTTVIENAAMEPEIVNLGEFLQKMGARIHGLGTRRISIEGVPGLRPANFEVIPDRIEAGTFLVAGLITGGRITLRQAQPEHLSEVLSKLEEAGAQLSIDGSTIHLKANRPIRATHVTTAVYPGFPTDMQAQWIALMSLADGSSVVTDAIFPDRFTHVPELNRFGADIVVKNNSAFIRGVSALKGAPVTSTDLRASASLVLAALAAEGHSEVYRVYHIDRGYERIEEKLQKLGARIRREASELPY